MNPKHTHSFFRNKVYPIIWIIGLLLIPSCTEDIPEPLFTDGVITGNAHIYYEINHDNIEVGSSGPYGKKRVLTDSQGSFWITGLGNGTYELIFKKDGYGSIHIYGVQIFGNDTVKVNATLYKKMNAIKIPDFIKFHDPSAIGMREGQIIIETNRGVSGGLPPLRFFLDTRDNVSYQNYQYTKMGYPLKRSGWDHILYTIDLYGFQNKSGTQLYLKAYMCNEVDVGYFDNYHGNFLYSTLDKENCTKTLNYKLP